MLISVVALWASLFLVVVHLISNKRKRGLSSVPGPFLASITNLWRMWDVHGRRPERTLIELHEKHGDLVRIGPNFVSVADPAAVPVIYGIKRLFWKSEFYYVQQNMFNGRRVQSLFNTIDEDHHKALKRPVAASYAMSTLVEFEPFVDSTSAVFIARLEELFADKNDVCDIGEWLHWYAFDVIGEMTYSRRLGFLEKGKDVEGIIKWIDGRLDYWTTVGQIPWLDYLLGKNPLWLRISRTQTNAVAKFAIECMKDRHLSPQPSADEEKPPSSPLTSDFLSRFNLAHQKNPDVVPPQQVIGYTASNIFAGSDTTAITLRAILYFLLRNPSTLRKLRSELECANLSEFPQWKETKDLPYLGAVIKEGLRIHPAVGLPLERIVPRGGVELCGRFFQEGTVVGVNPWVVHRNETIFGDDAHEWNPERWLINPERDEEEEKRRLVEMDRCDLAFGAGKRTCIGKNISLLEIYKLIPLLLVRFEIELAHLEREWKIKNSWFVGQTGFEVFLRKKTISKLSETQNVSTSSN